VRRPCRNGTRSLAFGFSKIIGGVAPFLFGNIARTMSARGLPAKCGKIFSDGGRAISLRGQSRRIAFQRNRLNLELDWCAGRNCRGSRCVIKSPPIRAVAEETVKPTRALASTEKSHRRRTAREKFHVDAASSLRLHILPIAVSVLSPSCKKLFAQIVMTFFFWNQFEQIDD